MAALAAEGVGARADEVLVLSTGVIGVFLDMEKLARGIEALRSPAAPRSAGEAARAITTTDTRPKVASAEAKLAGGAVRVSGFAKGAGMIHPNMATMLAVITTDARIAPERLDGSLRAAVARSFNRISVDGDMSTNDTVLVLASGASGIEIGEHDAAFDAALAEVCVSLARQIARDGEGATRLVEIAVTGARSEGEAHRVGDAIACSPLVKTAVHGADPNWGRILAAAGYSGAEVEPERTRLWFGAPGAEVQLLERGLPIPFDRARASALLHEDPALVHLDLGRGQASATIWTCDLSAEYVRVNAEYTT
jgi:glutamate N-acetyltransferase/amino-acid N-acetyltransferase